MADPQAGQPANDIYTLLVILATVVLAVSTIYMAVQSQTLFGTWNPFS